MIFSADSLRLDGPEAVRSITQGIRDQIQRRLRRRGAVIGLSGGINSSVTAALCVAALGPSNVLAVLMPEKDSDPESMRLGRLVADTYGIRHVVEDIAPTLSAAGCYLRRDGAIRELFPDFGPDWSCKVVLSNALHGNRYSLTKLVVQSPTGERKEARMPLAVYQAVVAATNMKQRTRKQLEYYHADRLNYAVAGTPNRLEYDQGFFVKNGDGAADFKPIAHLYKSQVYQLAEELGIPAEIRRAAADDRHLVDGADAGGVLFRAALRADGPLPLRLGKRHSGGRSGARDGIDARAGAPRVAGH